MGAAALAKILLFVFSVTIVTGSYQHEKYEDSHNAPQPYRFGYEVKDKEGSQFRHEEGDGNGSVKGKYGYKDDKGIYREVEYVADKNGFRAHVKTNEPGTANQDPADVKMDASPQYNHYQGSEHNQGHNHHISSYTPQVQDHVKFVPHVPQQQFNHHFTKHVPEVQNQHFEIKHNVPKVQNEQLSQHNFNSYQQFSPLNSYSFNNFSPLPGFRYQSSPLSSYNYRPSSFRNYNHQEPLSGQNGYRFRNYQGFGGLSNLGGLSNFRSNSEGFGGLSNLGGFSNFRSNSEGFGNGNSGDYENTKQEVDKIFEEVKNYNSGERSSGLSNYGLSNNNENFQLNTNLGNRGSFREYRSDFFNKDNLGNL